MVSIKDSVVKWYITNVVMPKVEIFDKPGFIVTKFTFKGRETYQRVLFLPEKLFENLEIKIVERYGCEGKQRLYSAGKKFGYRFSKVCNFPNIQEVSKKEFMDFVDNFMMFVGVKWATKTEHKIDFKLKRFWFGAEEYIICRNNGLGYLMLEGCDTGWWAYMVNDVSTEGAQVKCQGKNHDKCELICAHHDVLLKENIKFFTEQDISVKKFDQSYADINKICKAEHADLSLRDLINSGVFSYFGKRVLKFKNERHFPCEVGLIYLLEIEMKKLKNGQEILFNTSFDYGKKLAKNEAKVGYRKFITDYMSALGWGDILVTKKSGKYKIYSKHFPWTEFLDEVDFTIYRGILSGLLSEFLDEKILLKQKDKQVYSDSLLVAVSQR